MRIRARHIQHLEILTDNVTGLFLNYWICYTYLTYVLETGFTHHENLGLSAIVFVVAYISKYFWRRKFSNLIKRVYDRRKAQEDAEQIRDAHTR